MNITGNMPRSAAGTGINASRRQERKPIGLLAREWLGKYLPGKVRQGMPSLAEHFAHWEPGASYVIAGRQSTGARSMALTLAENFAAHGGHVIWVGVTEDLPRMSEQLLFKIAGLELAEPGFTVLLDAAAQCKLKYAHEQIGKMWIDFCNVEDCGDADVEQKFLASVASFKPTLVVVDESVFDETTIDPFEILVRQTHALHMVKELRGTNPMSSVLWHLPMLPALDDGVTKQRPTPDEFFSAPSSIKPDVVLLTHVSDERESMHNAELIIAANAFGTTGIVPMVYDPTLSTWY
ncbi:hypothetical protein [Massilia antarctica]|uniref:hypothetical protein n=1 Tax=Massilia antarctica TaxID=2765360 RepID=UPI0022707BB6|nr:hypothetical protein [Massilia sp. H27-R4]MCY0910312.1 hypothetical protein [Massilia sp. H27-R4]